MRKSQRALAIVSFTNAEVLSALQDKFYSRFAESGVRTGTLFLEIDHANETVSFIQYEGDVR